ncbi:MAG: hypothetical protein J0M34_06535 [Alphaproteobacteria bacterium]|nr:hypothetical protein [Alphaproteobacteria bacterium]
MVGENFINDRTSDTDEVVNRDDLTVVQAQRQGRYSSTVRAMGQLAMYEEILPAETYRAIRARYATATNDTNTELDGIQLSPENSDRFLREVTEAALAEMYANPQRVVAYFEELQRQGMLPERFVTFPVGGVDTEAEAQDLIDNPRGRSARSLQRIRDVAAGGIVGAEEQRILREHATWLVEAGTAHVNDIDAVPANCGKWVYNYPLTPNQDVKLLTDQTPRYHPLNTCTDGVCTLTVELERALEPVIAAAPVAVQPTPTRVLVQEVLSTGSREEQQLSVDYFNLIRGRQPRDVAADGPERRDMRPGRASEGTLVQDGTGRDASVTDTSRNRGAEATFRPQRSVNVDQYGQATDYNEEQTQKLETTPRLVFDADGNEGWSIDGSALISINRRRDPDFENIFTNFSTARNRINELNATAEGLRYFTSLRATEDLRQPLIQSTTPLSFADSERALQLTLRTALNPLVRSEYGYGVELNRDLIRADYDRVLASALANESIPQADRDRLRATYAGYSELLDDPLALANAVADHRNVNTQEALYTNTTVVVDMGGRESDIQTRNVTLSAEQRAQLGIRDDATGADALFNPEKAIISQRVEIRDIRRAYRAEDQRATRDRESSRQTQTREVREVLRYAQANADRSNAMTTGAPNVRDIDVATGVTFNNETQTTESILQQATELQTALGDPANEQFRNAYVDYVLSSQDNLSQILEIYNYATNPNGASENWRALGFETHEEALNYTRRHAKTLSGNNNLRGNLQYEDNRDGFLFFSWENRSENLRQGQEVAQAMLARYNSPTATPEDRAIIRRDLMDMIGRIDPNSPQAAPILTRLMNSVSLDVAYDTGSGIAGRETGDLNPRYQAIIDAQPAELDIAEIGNNWDMYRSTVDGRNLAANIAISIQQRINNGENIVIVDDDRAIELANAAIDNNSTVVDLPPPEPLASALADPTVLAGENNLASQPPAPTDGRPVIATTLLSATTAGAIPAINSDRITENQMNSALVDRLALQSPALYSQLLVAGFFSGDQAARQQIALELQRMAGARGNPDQAAYAELMSNWIVARANAAQDANPQAAVTAIDAAFTDQLNSYFNANGEVAVQALRAQQTQAFNAVLAGQPAVNASIMSSLRAALGNDNARLNAALGMIQSGDLNALRAGQSNEFNALVAGIESDVDALNAGTGLNLWMIGGGLIGLLAGREVTIIRTLIEVIQLLDPTKAGGLDGPPGDPGQTVTTTTTTETRTTSYDVVDGVLGGVAGAYAGDSLGRMFGRMDRTDEGEIDGALAGAVEVEDPAAILSAPPSATPDNRRREENAVGSAVPKS